MPPPGFLVENPVGLLSLGAYILLQEAITAAGPTNIAAEICQPHPWAEMVDNPNQVDVVAELTAFPSTTITAFVTVTNGAVTTCSSSTTTTAATTTNPVLGSFHCAASVHRTKLV